MLDTQMLFDPLEKQLDLPAHCKDVRCQAGSSKLLVKTQAVVVFLVIKTDAAQILRIN